MSIIQKYIVVKDRVEIYKDFTISLLNYIIDYYLDAKTLSSDNDIRNHFNFCYNKVCDEFKLENINFSDNKKLNEYFYKFYYYQIYKKETNIRKETNISEPLTAAIYEKFWYNVFEIDKQKNKNIINTLIEIYTIFDESINREKHILEII